MIKKTQYRNVKEKDLGLTVDFKVTSGFSSRQQQQFSSTYVTVG